MIRFVKLIEFGLYRARISAGVTRHGRAYGLGRAYERPGPQRTLG